LSEAEGDWIKNLIDKSKAVTLAAHEQRFADLLIQQSFKNAEAKGTPVGNSLAAAFDLYVAIEYYRRVAHRGWLYCPVGEPLLIYPFTNVCPRCVLSGQFHYHPANKPESGAIGTITRRLLCVFLKQLFQRQGSKLQVLSAPEPVDMILIDEQEKTVLLAEVKAAPLATLPLVVPCEPMTEISPEGETVALPHTVTDNPVLSGSEISLLLPRFDNGSWQTEFVRLGKPDTSDLTTWFYEKLEQKFGTDDALFSHYFAFWMRAYGAYNKAERDKDTVPDRVYWLTNACGQPVPRPADWKKRNSGEGYESVSDGKSSVGMDRTDDIKKGIYQVLKIAAASKPKRGDWQVKTALISNIHAVRHYDEYLLDLQDIVWTVDATGTAKTAKDLAPDAELFNLFDGIIAFTRNYARDEWIERQFQF